MAKNDWAELSDNLNASFVRRGATAGTVAPNGGGSYAYGMHSVDTAPGAVGLYCVQTDYNPTAKGGRVTGALKRGLVGGPAGFAPFLFFAAQGDSVNDEAYLLGLSDNDVAHIELRKGAIFDGLPDASVEPAALPNVLMRSTDTFPPNIWQHLRLDCIVQGNGDVILQVYRNDLNQHPVGNPVWALVPGMEGPFAASFAGFVDDALGINTGSLPLRGGRVGFGSRFTAANRATFFDHIGVERQL